MQEIGNFRQIASSKRETGMGGEKVIAMHRYALVSFLRLRKHGQWVYISKDGSYQEKILPLRKLLPCLNTLQREFSG